MHEAAAPRRQPGPGLGPGQHPGQHRVIPVHGEAVLGSERLAAAVADGVDQPGQGQLPAGALLAGGMGDGQTAPQAVADRRRPGEQSEGPRSAVGVAGPQDLAPGRLQPEDEVEGPLGDRPHLGQEPGVPEAQPVMPHARGDVGDRVGVQLVLVDPAGGVVLVPGPVGPLVAGQPLVGGLGLLPASGHREGHGRLDMVPGIGDATVETRDHAAGQLAAGDRLRGAVRVRPRQQSGHHRSPARAVARIRRHGSIPSLRPPVPQPAPCPACRRTPRGSSQAADSAAAPPRL